jgi:GntR family transcriptional repressor for pyruvate dehydrogenase complex
MADQGAAFAPLDRSTLSQQVRDQIESRIRSGELAPGNQVPSERSLSEQFGVARTSVREAMQGLVTMGLVERRGNRSYVAERLPELVVETDGRKAFVRELFETRRVLELPILELAATRAGDQDRAAIAALAAEFDQELSLADFRRLDRRFHTRTAAAAGNPLLVEVYGKVLDRLFRSDDFTSLLYASENQPEVLEIVRQSSCDHIEIADAIASADPARTVAAAARHLENVEDRMIHDLH